MQRIRVAALQYFIRPVQTFDQFFDQVRGLIETAADHRCQLVVFPEYFTLQLLTLGDVRRPIEVQLRELAAKTPRVVEALTQLTKSAGLYVLGGTLPVIDPETQVLHNEAHLFSPEGKVGVQGKLYMTRFEAEEWNVAPRDRLKVFNTAFGRVAITICYDVEFPELARSAALAGAQLLLVPSCTEDRQGLLRVRYCAQARAIENQLYVVVASTVGSLPNVPAVSLNYGQAAILTPSDFSFSRDGILAEGLPNQETMIIGELNFETLRASHESGTVLPLRDARRARERLTPLDEVLL
ncbi:MAG: carbon-nitrogen hydrolase family protein [Myxococcota bacterium]|nr:carbon-nitrogen hydrolase family protein [Myxococcota bacterium]